MATAGRSRLRTVIGLLAASVAYSVAALLPVGTARPDTGLTVGGAVALALAVVFVAEKLHVSRRAQFGVWFALVFLNLGAVAVEGTLFAPAAAPPAALGANLVRLLAAAAAVAAVPAYLFGGGDEGLSASRRTIPGWAWRVVAGAAVYCALYFIVGGVNYSLVTRPYYEAHAGSLTVPAAQTVLLYEPVRGLAIALSVLPLILAIRLRPSLVALITGLLLFVTGGLVPLLPQTSLPLDLRVASLWEIFAQNFLTGVACTYLFLGASPEPRHRTAGRVT